MKAVQKLINDLKKDGVILDDLDAHYYLELEKYEIAEACKSFELSKNKFSLCHTKPITI